jgi:hypothetical protein
MAWNVAVTELAEAGVVAALLRKILAFGENQQWKNQETRRRD